MEGKKDQIEDLSDQRMRLIVKKDSDIRLRSELIGSQSILTPDEIIDLSRSSLVGYVTLLRQLNKSTTSCRNVIDDFDPKQSKIISDDNNDSARSKSVSDDRSSREGPISIGGLVQSQIMTQSIGSTTDTPGIVKSIDYLITLQREERIEKERQLKEEKVEKERQLKQERIEKEIKEKEEKAEIQRLFDLKEKREKEEKADKEKREKEEREERWRIEREDRIERERIRADKLVEREAKDRKDQLDREQRKIEFEQLLLK